MVPMDLPEDSLVMIRELIWEGGVGKTKRRQQLQGKQNGVCDLDAGGEGGRRETVSIESDPTSSLTGEDDKRFLRKTEVTVDFKDGSNPSKPCKTYVPGQGNPPIQSDSKKVTNGVSVLAYVGVLALLLFGIRSLALNKLGDVSDTSEVR